MRKPGPYCFLIGTVCRRRCDHHGLETWSPFPVPVLAPGNGETKTGRLWACSGRGRDIGCPIPPGCRRR